MYDTRFYTKSAVRLLRHPSSAIPFHTQGMPIPDIFQKHTQTEQRDVMNSAYNKSNSLASGRFLGTDWTQNNQPHFLGANERIVWEGSW